MVELLGKRGDLLNGEVDIVRQVLLMNAHRDGLTQFGLANAITATAGNELISYDRAHQLEQLGGELITLPASDFNRIISAA